MRPLTATTHLLASLAITAAAVAAAFALPATADAMTITIGGDDGKAVAGSGREVEVARRIGPFTTLRLEGPVDVEARAGAAPGVVVHAEDNLEPLIETVVEGDVLVVRVRKGASFRTHRKLGVDVTFTTLSATQQRGSGDLRLTGVSGPKLDASISGSGDLALADARLGTLAVDIAGSGDIQASGRADEARFSVAGSGDIDAGKLAAKRVSVTISGSGDAHVNATESLDARVAGSGDVSYTGHPRDVHRKVSGSGSVESAD